MVDPVISARTLKLLSLIFEYVTPLIVMLHPSMLENQVQIILLGPEYSIFIFHKQITFTVSVTIDSFLHISIFPGLETTQFQLTLSQNVVVISLDSYLCRIEQCIEAFTKCGTVRDHERSTD